MCINNTTKITVFRTSDNDVVWLYNELHCGRLRQGWGKQGCALITDGRRVEKQDWEASYREVWGEQPTSRRFAILSYMLGLNKGDVVVVPKMPESNQFTIARVSKGYEFEEDENHEDFRHIVHVDLDSVRIFNYQANRDAFLVSSLFARAKHMPAISFCYGTGQIDASLRLLEQQSNRDSQPQEFLIDAAIDAAFKSAAEALQNQIFDWNGQVFEKTVRQAFRDQGYSMIDLPRYNREGADADILVSPSAGQYGVFLPREIVVQVKWIQDVDQDDTRAVEQIINWAEWQGSDATMCVISSTSEFTPEAQRLAEENEVILIGGLQTMCFLLGVPDRYRDDWDD